MLFRVAIGFASFILFASNVHALELAYKWKQGEQRKFEFRSKTTLKNTNGRGLFQMGLVIQNRVFFTRKVLQTLPNGSARVRFTIKRVISSFNGRKVISTRRLPLRARQWTALVNRFGKPQARHHVGYIVREKKLHFVSYQSTIGTQQGQLSVSVYGTAQIRGHRVRGSIRLSQRVQTVQLKKDETPIELLPKDLFDLMTLPERQMKENTSVRVKTPFMKIKTTLGRVRKGNVRLSMNIQPPQTQKPSKRKPAPRAMNGFLGMPGGMPGGMKIKVKGNAMNFNMGSGGALGSMQAMMPKVKGVIGLFFSVKKGQILHSSGWIEQVIPQVSLSIHTRFALHVR